MPGTWHALTHQPSSNVERILLLTDGTLLCHLGQERWSVLRPDSRGQYHDATWSGVDWMHHPRRWFGATVLSDGRVLVAFGWPNLVAPHGLDGDLTIEVFDPSAPRGRQWTLSPALPGWGADRVGQTHICALQDGRHVLVGTDVGTGPGGDFGFGRQSSLYDMTTSTFWLVDPGFERGSDLQAWTLLADGSVLSTNGHPDDFRYIPDAGSGRWVSAGHARYSSDVYIPWEGMSLLLPDGRVWVVSKVDGETAFYTPPSGAGPGGWTSGPTFPTMPGEWHPETGRLAACLLPSGIVLYGVNNFFDGSLDFYEFDPFDGDGRITRTSQPGAPVPSNLANPGALQCLLPTGEVIMGFEGRLFIYSPAADSRAPRDSWRPRITYPVNGDQFAQGTEVTLRGSLFNGMSQAVCHNPWKNAGTATNFPIVRLENIASGQVWYPRSYRHSGMGVATGTREVFTHCRIPNDMPLGDAYISVIANGIESERIRIRIAQYIGRIIEPHEFNQLIGNLADGPLWVLGPHGIRPVPPFDGLNEKDFRERTKKAYGHVFMGLALVNAYSLRAAGAQQMDELTATADIKSMALREIETGLAQLRGLGSELEKQNKKGH